MLLLTRFVLEVAGEEVEVGEVAGDEVEEVGVGEVTGGEMDLEGWDSCGGEL